VRSGLHHCRIGAEFVMLDRLSDRYFLLAQANARDFSAFLEGDADPGLLGRLAGKDIISIEESPPTPFGDASHLVKARTSLQHDCPPAPFSMLWAEVVWEQFLARRALRKQGFNRVLTELALRRAAVSLVPAHDGYEAVAQAFQQSARYISYVGQCLPRSLAMMRMLLRRNLPAQLVIGVSLPFQAHCWVQADSTLLSDRIDMIRSYHPILVL